MPCLPDNKIEWFADAVRDVCLDQSLAKDSYSKTDASIAFPKLEHSEKFLHLELPAFLKALGELSDESVCDFGCGPGRYPRLIRKHTTGEVCGIDISAHMIEEARALSAG